MIQQLATPAGDFLHLPNCLGDIGQTRTSRFNIATKAQSSCRPRYGIKCNQCSSREEPRVVNAQVDKACLFFCERNLLFSIVELINSILAPCLILHPRHHLHPPNPWVSRNFQEMRPILEYTDGWPHRLLHVETMTSHVKEGECTYSGVVAPTYNIMSYTWGFYQDRTGQQPWLNIHGVD